MGKILTPKYFPFCAFPDGNTSPSRTLVKTMYEYWVAKTWRVRVFMQDNGAAQPPNPYYDFNFGLDANSEENIVCNPNFIYKSGSIAPPQFQDSYFQVFVADDATSSQIVGFFTRYNEANDDTIYIGNLSGLEQTGTASISFGDGHTISVPFAIVSQQPGTDPAGFYELITNVQIIIQDYWSYGGTYNTSTGQILT
jgi:hypothetical protein